MKRKFLRMVCKTKDGDVVKELSKDNCVPEQVMAALHFIDTDFTIELSVYEVDVVDSNKK